MFEISFQAVATVVNAGLDVTRAIRSHGLVIRSLELDNPFSRIAFRSLDFNIQQFEGSNCNPRERDCLIRITTPWERIAQIDITLYSWLFWNFPCPFRAFVTKRWCRIQSTFYNTLTRKIALRRLVWKLFIARFIYGWVVFRMILFNFWFHFTPP